MTRQRVVAGIVIIVGLYDVSIGLFMLFSPSPFLAHGPNTVWTYDPRMADSQIRILLASLFDRIGAFSLHAGLASIVWCATSWRNRKAMSALLLTYLVSGLAFVSSDLRYFAGTTYFVVKQVLGAFWMLAIILHFWHRDSAQP
jgi:hypothetical protein